MFNLFFINFNFTILQSSRTKQVFLNYPGNKKTNLRFIQIPTEAADVVIPDRIELSTNSTAINETFSIDNETVQLKDSPLSVSLFKVLCLYKPISDERLKCMLKHENEQKYKNHKLRYTQLPVPEKIQNHLINYHRISSRVLNTLNEYSDGLVTISLTSMVI